MQDQEIYTNAMKVRREQKDKPSISNASCRLCHMKIEDIYHITGPSPKVASNIYLHTRHNPIAEALFKEVMPCEDGPEEPIMKSQDKEIWWDSPISTTRRVIHNRPDLVVQKCEEKQCYIIDISVPLDRNIKAKEKEKLDAYMPLLTELKSLYP